MSQQYGESYQGSSGGYPEQSQATLVLVLAIIGIVLCQILCPVAWAIGNTEIKAIDAGRRPPENRSTANAGRIIGIIGTVLMVIGLGIFILLFAGGMVSGALNS